MAENQWNWTQEFRNEHIFFITIFFYLGFLSRTFTDHRTLWEGEGISLTPHYHFHPLHRRLDISRAITAGSSPLHIASSRNWTRNLWFPSASRYTLSYAPLIKHIFIKYSLQYIYNLAIRISISFSLAQK